MGTRALFRFVTGIIFKSDSQVGFILLSYGIGIEKEIVFGKTIVAVVAVQRGKTFGFLLKVFFRKYVTHIYRKVGRIRSQQITHKRVRDLVAYAVDKITFA